MAGAAGFRFAIVISRFNERITESLRDAARTALREAGAADADVEEMHVPGAFELPQAARCVAETGRFDAVLCLGCVIRGGTPHFDYVASEVTKGSAAVQLDAGVPVSLGVLTTGTIEQAIERAGTKHGNKGWEAAMAAIEMVGLRGALGIE